MSVDQQRQAIRRNLGLATRKGKIIRVNGSISDASGFYNVQFGDRSVSKLKARGAFYPAEGVPVLVGFDPATQTESILGQDTASRTGNVSTFTGNPLDPRNVPPTSSSSLSDLLPRVVGTDTLTLTVGGTVAPFRLDGDWYTFGGATIDLSAHVPATADQHRYAVVGYWPPFGRLYAYASPEKSDAIALGSTDIDAAWDSRPVRFAALVPVAAVRLATGQTALSPSDVRSLRQLVNEPPLLGYPDPVTDVLFVAPGRTVKVDSLTINTGGVVAIGAGSVLSINP